MSTRQTSTNTAKAKYKKEIPLTEPASEYGRNAVYVLPKIKLPCNGTDTLATKMDFYPDKHDIIVRTIELEKSDHSILLMHFIPTSQVLLWDFSVRPENAAIYPMIDDDLLAADNILLDHHAKWTEGTTARATHGGGTRWSTHSSLGHGLRHESRSPNSWITERINYLYCALDSLGITKRMDNYAQVIEAIKVTCYVVWNADEASAAAIGSHKLCLSMRHASGLEV
ncbi:hypothetical protein PT974_00324 [Cladobotryum mycophilum]|uniref:Uncharacterized protein n=1 Tax=Cladobotryum mycophilum TaxID=491253 RepID=A0ABR0T1R7_9HYPO